MNFAGPMDDTAYTAYGTAFSQDGLAFLRSDSLCSLLAPFDVVSGRKRSRGDASDACFELLDDSSALHEWPVQTKRPRHDNVDFVGSFVGSPVGSPPRTPARPRAYAMDIYEGVPADNHFPTKTSRESNELFVRFARMADKSGIIPLRVLSADNFPAAAEMRNLVQTIVAR